MNGTKRPSPGEYWLWNNYKWLVLSSNRTAVDSYRTVVTNPKKRHLDEAVTKRNVPIDELEPVTSKVAGSGLYGYNKATERDILVAIKKLEKATSKIAKAAYEKDAEVVPFLQTHAKRWKSKAAIMLLHAMRELFPVIEDIRIAKTQSLYGFKPRTVTIGIEACGEVLIAGGEIAADLHERRGDKREILTQFLKLHTEATQSEFAELLYSCYPLSLDA